MNHVKSLPFRPIFGYFYISNVPQAPRSICSSGLFLRMNQALKEVSSMEKLAISLLILLLF